METHIERPKLMDLGDHLFGRQFLCRDVELSGDDAERKHFSATGEIRWYSASHFG